MVKHLELMLDGPGIVFFDPFVLTDFLNEKQITSQNLFQLFNDKPAIGDEAIKRGIVLPIYTIPPIDYQIILNDTGVSEVRKDWAKFTTTAFPLEISINGRLVAADIYAIMEWEAAFYQELPLNGPKAPQAVIMVPQGRYSVIIKGFVERNFIGRGPKNIGYELLLEKVEELPTISQQADSDSFDFTLWQPGQSSTL